MSNWQLPVCKERWDIYVFHDSLCCRSHARLQGQRTSLKRVESDGNTATTEMGSKSHW